MPKTPEKFPWTARQIRAGRGQGVGKDYVSWLHVGDFSSRGKSSRFKSWKHGRVVQLTSDIETSFAYLLEWSDAVVDYQEQFPLLPLEETLGLADELGVTIPVDKDSKEPRVRTTDFLVHVQSDEKVIKYARAIKPAEELSKKSPVLFLELERRFWAPREIDWAILTERDISLTMAKNIEWLHDARTLDDHEDIAALPLSDIFPELRIAIEARDRALAHTCLAVDNRLGLKPSTCLFLIRHQLATKAWRIDMRVPIKTHQPLELLPDPQSGEDESRGVA